MVLALIAGQEMLRLCAAIELMRDARLEDEYAHGAADMMMGGPREDAGTGALM